MSGPGQVDYANLWKNCMPEEQKRYDALEAKVKLLDGGTIERTDDRAFIQWLQNSAVPTNGYVKMWVNLKSTGMCISALNELALAQAQANPKRNLPKSKRV